MKKHLLLIIALVASVAAIAQNHGSMNFIGNSTFTASTASQDNVKDTVIVSDDNSAITLPEMHYNAMSMTLPSIKFVNLQYTMTGSYTTNDMAFTWEKEYADTTITLTDGTTQKQLKDVKLKVTYTHNTGELKVDATFQYGSMTFPIHYEQTGYYTVVPNAWNLVGRGTQENPYRLYDAADYKSMADSCDADNSGKDEYFVMMNAIDFNNGTFTPIAFNDQILPKNSPKQFAGTFDGQTYAVKNLTIGDEAKKSVGFISTLAANGVVKNLTIDESCKVSGAQYVGGVVGMCMGSVINCNNYADVTTKGTSAGGIIAFVPATLTEATTVTNCKNYGNITASTYAGGCVGMALSPLTVTSCTNNGTIKVVGSQAVSGAAGSAQHVAGIVAGGSGACTISYCTNNGDVVNNGFDATLYPEATTDKLSATGNGQNVGGIMAYSMNNGATISNCVNNGSVTGLNNVGGILGNYNKTDGKAIVKNCTNTGTVTNNSTIEANLLNTGNLRGSANINQDEGNIINSSTPNLNLDPKTDAIDNVTVSGNAQKAAYKAIRNGKLVIIKNGVEYNAAGAIIK